MKNKIAGTDLPASSIFTIDSLKIVFPIHSLRQINVFYKSYMSMNDQSIHLLNQLNPFGGCRVAGAYSSHWWAKVGYTQNGSAISRRSTKSHHIWTHQLTFEPCGRTVVGRRWVWKKTHTCTGRTSKLHTETGPWSWKLDLWGIKKNIKNVPSVQFYSILNLSTEENHVFLNKAFSVLMLQ